jgi:hypothetical protein
VKEILFLILGLLGLPHVIDLEDKLKYLLLHIIFKDLIHLRIKKRKNGVSKMLCNLHNAH